MTFCSSTVAFATMLPGVAVAAVLSVPGDYPTIQEAVDASQQDDVIRIGKGSYAPFTIDTKSGLTLRGRGNPVVDGGGAAGAVVNLANVTGVVLEGLVIRNSGGRGVLVTDSADVTIRRSAIEEIESDAIRAWGSTRLLIEKSRITDAGSGVDFSAEDAAGPTSESVVRKNRFEQVGQAVDIDGSSNRVEKNAISNTGETAISLDDGAVNATIAKNKLTNTESAMELHGSGHVVEKNTVKGTRDEGIVVVATGCRIEKNKLDGVLDDAIDLEGDDNEILANKIKNSGDNGIEVSPASGDPFPVTGNVMEKNKISGSGGNGIFVDTSGNTFRRNNVKKSAGFDLLDEAGEGANTYEDNKFGTESIS
jgi:parallel beta-helix repeat protein